jgi:hypothetical protein
MSFLLSLRLAAEVAAEGAGWRKVQHRIFGIHGRVGHLRSDLVRIGQDTVGLPDQNLHFVTLVFKYTPGSIL